MTGYEKAMQREIDNASIMSLEEDFADITERIDEIERGKKRYDEEYDSLIEESENISFKLDMLYKRVKEMGE